MVPTLSIPVAALLKMHDEGTARLRPVVCSATVDRFTVMKTNLAPLQANRDELGVVVGQDLIYYGKRDAAPIDIDIVAP